MILDARGGKRGGWGWMFGGFFRGLKVANMVVKRLPSRVERERGGRREKDTWWKMKDKALFFLIYNLP